MDRTRTRTKRLNSHTVVGNQSSYNSKEDRIGATRMKIANIKNAHLYYGINKRIKVALNYIENTDLVNLENGKYEIDGKNVFAIVQDYQTKFASDAKWEAHKEYTDIQYIIKGREQIGWGPVEDFSPITPYDNEKDIIFLSGEGDFAELGEKDFAIITPEYAHMPGISINNSESVKKLVIKVLNS